MMLQLWLKDLSLSNKIAYRTVSDKKALNIQNLYSFCHTYIQMLGATQYIPLKKRKVTAPWLQCTWQQIGRGKRKRGGRKAYDLDQYAFFYKEYSVCVCVCKYVTHVLMCLWHIHFYHTHDTYILWQNTFSSELKKQTESIHKTMNISSLLQYKHTVSTWTYRHKEWCNTYWCICFCSNQFSH